MSATESISKKLFDALSNMVSMHSAMMAKTNIGASFYDADTLRAMNDAPIAAGKALDEYAAGENERRWEMRVVVISTAHLREETCNTFLCNLAGDDNDVIELLDGYIVRAGDHIDHIDDIPESYPEELQEALVWAMNRGYTHVRFDSDGDVVSGLTDFDW